MVGPNDPFGGRLRSALPLDPDASDFYERALKIGTEIEDEGPPITFTAGMLALLTGKDALSSWFVERAQGLGPEFQRVLAEKDASVADLDRAATTTVDHAAVPQLLTASSRALLDSACLLAQQVEAQEVGIRHILATYLLRPPGNHRAQLVRWGVNEDGWRVAFYDYVATIFTSERWRDAREVPAPQFALESFSLTEDITPEKLDWPGDELAERILRNARAAHEHAISTGKRMFRDWLQTRMIVFSLVECAELSDTVKTQIAPLTKLLDDKAYAAAKERAGLSTWKAAQMDSELAKLALTPRLANLLETARQLARSRTNAKVAPLDLVAALAARHVDANPELAEIGVDPAALRKGVLAAIKGGPVEVWSDVMDPDSAPFAARPIKLDSDDPEAEVRGDQAWNEDPLRRKPDVEAFGALLAAKDLDPPLSIGVFGPWGSGKTTFLRRLKLSVDRHTQSKEAGYVENVVHVEFNAWHYAEADLTASIVDSVFRELDAFVGAAPKSEVSWLKQQQSNLLGAQQRAAAATAAHAAAQTSATNAQKALEDATKAAREKEQLVGAAIAKAWQDSKAELEKNAAVKKTGIVDAVGGVVTNATELRDRIAALRTPGRALATVSWGTWAALAIAMIGLPVAAIAVVKKLGSFDAVMHAITGVASALGVIAVGLKKASNAVKQVDEAGALVEQQYLARIEKAEPVVAARTAHDQTVAALQAAQTSVDQTQAELARAQTAVAEASLPAQVARLAASRIADKTYSSALGLVSTARDDFRQLSDLLRAQQSSDDKTPKAPKRVDRVILYIDDLDRCSAEQVVKVLQLVHMLLAFELFVVVVGVDAHWVRFALEHAVDGLGDGKKEGAPTPQEYLEKIFQIAFWLETMNPQRVARYLEALVRKRGAKTPAPRWDLDPIELDFMRALSSQVAASPRRIKRLVNVYRLIKARLSDTQLETFLQREGGTSGPYQIVISLLVIGVGAAEYGPVILDELANAREPMTLIEPYRKHEHRAYTMAAAVLETLQVTQPLMPQTELRGWALHVARYLLHPRAAAA